MTQTLFGLTLPLTGAQPLDVARTTALVQRMAAAAASLQDDAPAALASSVRRDAQRYLAARRRGELRLAGFAATRTCDESARALMQLTVDAPAVRSIGEPLVA